MDVTRLRRDFPLLDSPGDEPVVYFDNACMTLKPEPVLAAMDAYYREFPVCGGRSLHRLATEVTIRFEEARMQLAQFFNAAEPTEVVFTRNATEAINIVAHGLALKRGDRVLTTDREHNSNLVPWLHLQRHHGVRHTVIPSHDDYYFNAEALKERLTRDVKLVSVVHTSNLDGYTTPAREIVEIAHDAGALVMLDVAQSAPHQVVDAQALGADFIAASAHKFCGPSGTGLLYGRADALAALRPTQVGGSTVTTATYDDYELMPPPQCFEAGLRNYAGAIGAGAAADYVAGVGREAIHEHEMALNRRLTRRLAGLDGLELVGPPDPAQRGGIFPFNLSGLDSHEIVMHMDETAGVMMRSGMHCVHSWFHARGLEGCARASFYLYNTPTEVDHFADALEETARTLTR